MEKVTVKVFGTDEPMLPENFIGVTAARNGQPVEISIKNGNSTHTLHTSYATAAQLSDALMAQRQGAAYTQATDADNLAAILNRMPRHLALDVLDEHLTISDIDDLTARLP